MPKIIIDIDKRDISRVFAAISQNFNRKNKVPNPSFDSNQPESSESNPREIDNPESLEDFVERILIEFLSEHVRVAEVRKARRQADDSIDPKVRIKRGKRESV